MKIVKIVCHLTLLCLVSGSTIAQVQSSAAMVGTGGSGSATQGTWNVFANPASLKTIAGTRMILTSSMPFSIPDLLYSGMGISMAFNEREVFYGSIQNLGLRSYRDTRLELGYMRRLAHGAAIGAGMTAGLQYFEGYGTGMSIGYKLGIRYEPWPSFALALHVQNPVPITIDIRPSASLTAGLSYFATEKVTLSFDLNKDERAPLMLMAGVLYDLSEVLTLRLGTSVQPAGFHCGISLKCSRSVGVTFSTSYRTLLGFSPAVDITFTPGYDGDPDHSSNRR